MPSSEAGEFWLGAGLAGAGCSAAGSTDAIALTVRFTIPRRFGAALGLATAFRFAGVLAAAFLADFLAGFRAAFLADPRAALLAGLRAAFLAVLRAAFLVEVLRDFLAAFFADFLAFLAIEFLHSFLPRCSRAMRRLQPFIAHSRQIPYRDSRLCKMQSGDQSDISVLIAALSPGMEGTGS